MSEMAKKAAAAKQSGPLPDAVAQHREGPKLSTGVSVFNMILTGNPREGLQRGTFLFIVGDSSAGKSFLATTIAAQAAIDPNFKDYEIIYDDVENGALFDVPKLYSQQVADRIKIPKRGTSEFIDEFYMSAMDAVKAGPCVYILDSENGLQTREEVVKASEVQKAIEDAEKKGKGTAWALQQISGQMTDGKAKRHSQNLRKLVANVERSGSILVILGQTRDSMGDGYEEVTYSGGRALRFYSHVMAHMTVAKRLTKTVREKKREVGISSKFKLVKNRYIGKRSEIEAPIYYSVGFDEVGAMVDWLVDEGVWDSSTKIQTHGFMSDGQRETIIKKIEEDEELEVKLVDFVKEQWDLIEEKSRVRRKNRYSMGT